MKPNWNPLRSVRCGAFTLIEVVGVLAVLSIVAWAAMNGVWTHLKESIRRDESVRLEAVRRALQRSAVRQRGIPSATNWVETVAIELAEPVSAIQKNAAGWNRLLVVDPNCRVGNPALLPPYRQGPSGSAAPILARAVLLSTVAADYPNLASVRFDDLWERSPGRLPRNWSTRWGGKPEDLLVERVAFEGQFQRICLNNLDLDASAWVAVDGETRRWEIPAGSKLETYYLTETELIFLNRSLEIQWIQPVVESASFSYEGGRWRAGISSGPAASGQALATTFDGFVGSPVSVWGSTPRHVAAAMNELVAAYVAWAEEGFPQVVPIVGRSAPAWLRVQGAATQLNEASGLLLGRMPEAQP